jgi:uncharacterized protein (TIGR02996 family)
MKPRPEVLAFLADAKQHPEDDAPLLVLADWLEEHGDERGEFVRLQVGAWSDAEREAELLARNRMSWLGFLAEKGIRTEFQRGLVRVSGPVRKLLSKRLARLPTSEPAAWASHLKLYDFTADTLGKLASSPHWTCLAQLDLSRSCYWADQTISPDRVGVAMGDWSELSGAAVLAGLAELDLSCLDIGASGAAALVSAHDWKRLRRLDVSMNNLGDEGARGLAACRSLTGLVELNLSQNRIRADGFAALAGWRGLETVSFLCLSGNYPGAEGMAALATSPFLGNVTRLRLYGNDHPFREPFGPAWIAAAGAEALTGATGLRRLANLNLMRNWIGPGGAEALAASRAFPALTELELAENEIGDAGAVALANSPALRGLTHLSLRYNGIGDRGARALAESPYLGGLKSLVFLANRDASPEALAALRGRFGDAVDVG